MTKKRRCILEAMGVAMLFASGFSWWQTRIEEKLTGRAFWEAFLRMEALFAILICVLAGIILLARYLARSFKKRLKKFEICRKKKARISGPLKQ